jgi:hypothetical protein
VAHVHTLIAGVVYKLGILLINGVVCQVDVLFSQIGLVGSHILLSREASQPLFVNVEPQRTYPAQQNIHSEVKFESLDQQRP